MIDYALRKETSRVSVMKISGANEEDNVLRASKRNNERGGRKGKGP